LKKDGKTKWRDEIATDKVTARQIWADEREQASSAGILRIIPFFALLFAIRDGL
jgi:hypothetical protein